MRSLFAAFLFTSLQPAWSQPKFEAVDVRPTPKSTPTTFPFVRTGPPRGGRYEVKNGTMVDLIRIAYGYDTDKILGGPNWLELDRFDLIGKLPPDSTAEDQKLMLQAALEDRFKLAVRKESKQLPTFALVMGKKHQLKEAAGTEQPGCRPQEASGAPGPGGGPRLSMITGPGATPVTVQLGPGMTITYNCRNMTMEALAAALRTLIGASLGPNAIQDETGLKGNWNFELKYSMQAFGPPGGDPGERISMSAALEKQLGLKLEERQVSMPVLVVENCLRRPSENPPEVAKLLPAIAIPTEFEVASVKPVGGEPRSMMRFQIQPEGRLVAEGMPLRFFLGRAFNTNNNDEIVGFPSFVTNDRYDITAQTAPGLGLGPTDIEALAPMMLSLLKDRFKLKYHTEERPVQAYSLVAVKPKLKQADPSSRTFCKAQPAPQGAAPGSRVWKCQNTTMAQFAERLQNLSPELNWPVLDATDLTGAWDFSFMYSMRMPAMAVPAPRPPSADGGEVGAIPSAPEPVPGLTIFEAVEKTLGLKLEKGKRNMPIIVIDHIEQKPTEN